MDHEELKSQQIEGQSKLNGKSFPKVYTPNKFNNFVYLQEYFQKNHAKIIQQVSEQGAVFFRGFNVKSVTEMATILNKLGLSSFQYIGGAAVRKLVVGSEKRKDDLVQIFTTNQSPPQEPIPFHNELMQNSNYPDFLSFYCYREADTGGSTPLVNCHELYKFIHEKHPQFLEKLEKLKLRYIRVVGKEDNPNSPIGRGWKNIFKCETKQQAQQKMKANGYEWEWIDNQDQDCRLISQPLPGIRVSKSGKKVFCNQFAVFKGWVDNKNAPSKALRFGDFSEIPLQALQSIYQYSYKIKASISWKVGDFVIIDNEMAMHAREPFTGINRKIYASLFKGSKNIKQGLHLTLRSGDEMPMVGFGTWKLPNQVSQEIIYEAIKSGYRLIDCAGVYGNEVQIGRGIKRALDQKLVTREELFITSKLWNTFHRPQHVKAACQRTLSDLGLSYLNLYLIHYPLALKYIDPDFIYPTDFEYIPFPEEGPNVVLEPVPIIDTWRAMEQLAAEGLVKNIGVSNFNVSLLRDLINGSKIPPAVNQVQIHPFLTQKKLIRYCQQNGVQMTSYSTMGGASYVELNVAKSSELIVDTDVVKKIAQKHNKTAAQILFRWAIQQGLAIIPKTSKANRLKENSDVTGWHLSEEEMKEIDGLNQNKRYCDPMNFPGLEGYDFISCWN